MTTQHHLAQDHLSVLDGYIDRLRPQLAGTVRLTLEDRALTGLVRVVDRGRQMLAAAGEGKCGPDLEVHILNCRDAARVEQSWIDGLLGNEVFTRDVEELLHRYKSRLAQLEQAAMMALGFTGCDDEHGAEGQWWIERSGQLAAETASIGSAFPGMTVDPADPMEEEAEAAL